MNFMMRICQKCGRELEHFKGNKFVCSSETCDFIFIQPIASETQAPWYKRVCRDETLWQSDVFATYPCIIAHEYWRVRDLLDNGQPYGALLQLKDMFEVLIKFPTLIAASIFYGKRERSDAENKILVALLEKRLTLGTWEEIARTMCRKIPLDAHVSDILKTIVRVFEAHKITEWRNRTIAHGALAFEADEEFQDDIKDKLNLIKTYFQECAGAYATVTLFLSANEDRVELHGKEKARNLNYPGSEFFIQLGTQAIHSLTPYILLKERKVYFFDYYIPRDRKSAILNYPEGDRQNIPDKELARLYDNWDRENKLSGVQEDGWLGDRIYRTSEAETLDKIAAIDDFQTPKYLKTWLKNLIEKQAKGVFLLQMERGTGKTTFARALDQQSKYLIRIIFIIPC